MILNNVELIVGIGAIYDLGKNYLDMKQDNTIGADDYFHCKSNIIIQKMLVII